MSRVAILGGGPFVARLVDVLCSRPVMSVLELRLHAPDLARLAVIATHASARSHVIARNQGCEPHRVYACAALDDALAGADVVVLLVRVGGLAAREHDERFPAQFGLVGDEGLGVGGMANAWRTLPVLARIADRIAACAPTARVLDMIAPLGITTRLLLDRGLTAVGLCELPALTHARWLARSEPGVPLAYAGLNHLGWFWSPAAPALAHPVIRAAIAASEVTTELVARFDAAPLHYFADVFDPVTARALGRPHRAGRARALADLGATLVRRFADEPGAAVEELDRRPTPWFEHALVPAIHAALGGPPYTGALNVACGALAEVPAGVVVELFGRYDGTTAICPPVPVRPPAVCALLARFATADDLLYRAARARDRALLGESLAALPIELAAADREAVLERVCEPIEGAS